MSLRKCLLILVIVMNFQVVMSWDYLIASFLDHPEVNKELMITFARSSPDLILNKYKSFTTGWEPEFLASNNGVESMNENPWRTQSRRNRYYFAIENTVFDVPQNEREVVLRQQMENAPELVPQNHQEHIMIKVFVFDGQYMAYRYIPNETFNVLNYKNIYAYKDICTSIELYSSSVRDCNPTPNYPFMLGDRIYFFLKKGTILPDHMTIDKLITNNLLYNSNPIVYFGNYNFHYDNQNEYNKISYDKLGMMNFQIENFNLDEKYHIFRAGGANYLNALEDMGQKD